MILSRTRKETHKEQFHQKKINKAFGPQPQSSAKQSKPAQDSPPSWWRLHNLTNYFLAHMARPKMSSTYTLSALTCAGGERGIHIIHMSSTCTLSALTCAGGELTQSTLVRIKHSHI